jgi:hypothetical protein
MIIIIDSMEQHPFSFTGIRLDLSEMNARQRKAFDSGEWDGVVSVETKFRALGASNGDYTVEGFEGRCHLERKSMEDCHSTVLSYGDRRERFTRELANLASMESAAVIVECELSTLLANAPEYGVRTASQNRKHLFRQILAWQQQFKVPWIFCDGRAMAEIAAYRWFKCFVRYQSSKDKDLQSE